MGDKVEIVPGYLQPDPNCNINDIVNMRNQFLANLRRRRLPLRFEVISPYTNSSASKESVRNSITQTQLDMRRKAEILQHNKNSNQSSKLTKKEKFSKLVNGPFQRRTKTVDNVIYNVGPCSDDLYIPTLTSSSDVPGPITTLKYDKNIPLYNYSSTANNAITEGIDPNESWTFSTNSNISTTNNVSTSLMKLYIGVTDEFFDTFNISIPLKFYIQGSNTSIVDVNETISISNIQIQVFYANSSITNITPVTNITDFTNYNKSFTVSAASSPENPTDFSLTYYIGNFSISDLRLSTQYGIIYDIKLTFNIDRLVGTTAGNYNHLLTGIYMNATDNVTTSENITIETNTLSYTPFNITSDLTA